MSYHLSTVAMRQSAALRRNQNTVRVGLKRAGLGPVSNILMLASILCVMGFLYLAQVTKTTSFGYQVNDLNQRRSQLIGENQDLKVQSARLQALERIKTSEVAQSLGDPERIEYLPN